MNITDTLTALRRGQFIDELTGELGQLVDAVRSTGRKGTLTIQIDVALASKGDDTTLNVTDTIKLKLPQAGGGQTIMYATADGALTRRDPRQLDIDGLRTVETKERSA
jgi:hypothetical protein